MKRPCRILLFVLACLAPAPARAQIMSARRLAMGGVTILRGGPGSDAINVAYRAVPRGPATGTDFSLPIGLLDVLAHPPVLDPNDPRFNAFEIANDVFDPPWNYPLRAAPTPSNDLAVTVGRNELQVDLGDIGKIFPKDEVRLSGVARSPQLVVGRGRAFVGLSPLVEYDNSLQLNDALHGALSDGVPFQPLTTYALDDQGRGQAAAQAVVGWAQAIWQPEAAKGSRTGVYVGARAKLLRGLAYGDVDNTAAFTTADTLFGTSPIDVQENARIRTAGPADGGFGTGYDAGLVLVHDASELGVAVNDIATRIAWHVQESVVAKDSVSGDYKQQTVRSGVPMTSTVPSTYLVTASTRIAGTLVAADVVGEPDGQATQHVGLERWMGMVALRAGASRDASNHLEAAGGLGLRFGHLGLDFAVATNDHNLYRDQAVDLAAGLAFYH